MIYEDDVEKKNKLILEIADFFIENNSSTRKTGEKYGLSNFTIHNYLMEKLPKLDMDRFIKVAEIINSNKSVTIYGNDIQKELDDIYNCIKNKNMTIKETSLLLKISEKTIYQDIVNKFDKIRFDEIKLILKKHSMENSPFKK